MLLQALSLFALVQIIPPSSGAGASRPAPGRTADVEATRAAQAPVIDGRGDDPVWKVAPSASDFVQFQPHPDSAATFRTAFQVAYDAHNLYVFVRMHDPHPDSIMHALSRRDVRGPSDQIKIIVDS